MCAPADVVYTHACHFVCRGACVSRCKNVINPCSVSFSARYGKTGAEHLFTAHPFKTRGLFLFVQPERRQGM